ncbi:MAG: DUF1007 family protein [Marivibrio sp.]|uniref:DUF1007 family protein n=1 Tax=Marivibrio sp. TaxID=2039719 RepID=UPI0032ED1D6C
MSAWIKLLSVAAALLAAATLPSGGERGAKAHPHVWILAQAAMLHDGQTVTAVRLDWRFDEFFSAILFEDFDWNGDGAFTPDEVEAMRAGAFAGLSEVGWFTDLRADGKPQLLSDAKDFSVSVSPDGALVTYSLTLALETPIDPVERTLSLSIYDPEYYVSLEFDEIAQPIRIADGAGFSCTARIERDAANRLYFDLFEPPIAYFDCAPRAAEG